MITPAYRRRVLTALMIAQVMGGISAGVAFSLGALLAADIGGTEWGGAASTVTTVGAALFSVVLARVAAARGRRLSLTSGMVLGALGATGAMFAAEWRLLWLLLASFLLIGASSAVNLQSRFVAGDVAATATRGRDLSLVVWSTTIGAVAGPNLMEPGQRLSELLGFSSFSGAYVICIGAQAVAVLVLSVALHPDPVAPAAPDEETATDATSIRAYPMVIVVIASLAVAHAVMVAVMAMTPVHLHGHGASLRLIGITISAHVAGMYACSPLFGLLADRVGRRWTLALGFVVQLASLGLLIAYGQQDAAVVAALVLLGLGWSAALVSCSTLLIDAAPDTRRTHVQGRSDFTMNIVGAAGGAVAGPIVHNWGMPTLASLTGFLIIVAVVVLLPRVRDISTR